MVDCNIVDHILRVVTEEIREKAQGLPGCLIPWHNSALGVWQQRCRGLPQQKSTSERPIKLHKYPSCRHKLSSIGAESVLHNLKHKHWFLMLQRNMDMLGSQ